MDPVENLVLLKHIGGDRFRTIRSDDQPGHELVFQRDEQGRVSELSYHAVKLPKM
jgi:hypothetical protein